jgi:hypothetical protein
MRIPPDTPQLPLEFDSDERPTLEPPASGSNVVRLAADFFRKRPRQAIEPVDSMLEEVLTNAKRLNW